MSHVDVAPEIGDEDPAAGAVERDTDALLPPSRHRDDEPFRSTTQLHRPPLAGQCFENAAAEAFFSTLEHEVLSRHHFATKA
jgi:hypothetical protein